MPNFNGSADPDTFTGSSERDTIVGNGGDDTLSGAGGSDLIVGNSGADTLNGGDGDDTLYAGDESPPFTFPYYGNRYTPPLLDRSAERDVLTGGAGSDRLFGGYGDTIDGGANGSYGDYLFISFQGADVGVTYDAGLATQTIGGGVISGIENVSWVEGSNFNDVLTLVARAGGGYADFASVWGMGGNDRITAGYYTGTLFGNEGDDVLDGRGSQYLQSLDGGDGNDTLYTATNTFSAAYGGDGDDVIYSHGLTRGGAGDDVITIVTSSYPEAVHGDAGNDTINGSDRGNLIYGGAGADRINGGAGEDRLFAASDQDGTIDARGERDVLAGFGGNDTLSIGYGDSADGGSGTDTLRLSLLGATSGVALDTTQIATGGSFSFAGGVINSIELLVHLSGSRFNDTLTIATQSTLMVVEAGDGDDVVTSSGSSIDLRGGAGNDRFYSGLAGDIFDGGEGTDSVFYSNASAGVVVNLTTGSGSGGDTLRNVESVAGSAFNDRLTGSQGANALYGQAGDDVLTGAGGADVLDGGDGADTAVLSFGWTDGEIRYVDGAIRIAGPEGETILRGIEVIRFSDLTLAVGADGRLVLPTLIDGTSAAETLNGTEGAETIRGLDGDDRLNGLGGHDQLLGGEGQDILRGGAGSDRLDGGDDYDQALYSGGVRQYVVAGTATVGGSFTSTITNGREGAQTDTLVSVEEAVFLDGSLSFDRSGQAAQVMRLYDAAFNRTPDQRGFEQLHADLEGGRITLQALATSFYNSTEFQTRFGNLSNQAYVEQLYRFTLDRAGDTAGIQAWVNALNGGMSRGELLLAFSESEEHRNLTAGTLAKGLFIPDQDALKIARMYDATYDRLPDVGGLETWVNALKGGMSMVQIAGHFSAAPEFQARYGALSDRAFVEQLYRFNLNREGDAAGIQNWVNALASGLSRAELLLSFSESAEHVALTRDLWLGGVRFQGLASPVLDDKDAGALTLPTMDEGAGPMSGDDMGAPSSGWAPDDGSLSLFKAHIGADWWAHV